ncbi:hypothetical protein GKQ38_02440 [Candidatus Nanohaloarchaea archaeon]|nr:hypothetical protein GKQ38_02440 [Candidatus Nanohaloarchaea archaeon]
MRREYFVIASLTLLLAAGVSFNALNSSETRTGQFNSFSSEQQFAEYVSAHTSDTTSSLNGYSLEQSKATVPDASAGSSGTRYASTNNQVTGVQEPDILKNNGEEIFYSSDNYWGSNATVFDARPPENFTAERNLSARGRMVLSNDTLIFLGNSNITAYDTESYEEVWSYGLNNSWVEDARRYNGSLYVVLRKGLSSSCPVEPLTTSKIAVPCTSIYYPGPDGEVDSTYVLMKISRDGKVESRKAFLGSPSNTEVYMSKDNIYLTYSRSADETQVTVDFLKAEGLEMLDSQARNHLQDVFSYDLSQQALEAEIQATLRDYRSQLSESERKQFEKEFENAFGNYTDERKRKLVNTSIARFGLDNLKLEAEGSVPGEVNDQFSMDEQGEEFRIVTTVGDSWRFDAVSENDLYVLNSDLEVKSSLKGMGLKQRVYSARFIDNKAYVVTYRRTDPFHVIDLSGDQPVLEGKLKLEGYSSYLHPLSEDRILGVGRQNGSVKLTVFDVSGESPEISASKSLNESYSAALNNHHAFMIDRRHKAFFLPASDGGYIYSYSDGLEEIKKVELENPKRATYIGDTMYVFSSSKAVAINETSWETVKEVSLSSGDRRVYLPEPVLKR